SSLTSRRTKRWTRFRCRLKRVSIACWSRLATSAANSWSGIDMVLVSNDFLIPLQFDEVCSLRIVVPVMRLMHPPAKRDGACAAIVREGSVPDQNVLSRHLKVLRNCSGYRNRRCGLTQERRTETPCTPHLRLHV